MVFNKVQIAWAAGFLDGEGSFCNKNGTRKRTGRSLYHPRISAFSTDLDYLERLRQIFGVGIIRKVKKYSKLSRKQGWVWTIDRQVEVFAVCAAIYSFLGKRRQSQVREIFRILRAKGEIVSPGERSKRSAQHRKEQGIFVLKDKCPNCGRQMRSPGCGKHEEMLKTNTRIKNPSVSTRSSKANR